MYKVHFVTGWMVSQLALKAFAGSIHWGKGGGDCLKTVG